MIFMKTWKKWALAAAAFCTSGVVFAQTAPLDIPPGLEATDPVGVDLVSGGQDIRQETIRIGPEGMGMSRTIVYAYAVLDSPFTIIGPHEGGSLVYGDSGADGVAISWEFGMCAPATQTYCQEYDVKVDNHLTPFWLMPDGTFINKRQSGETLSRQADGSYLYVTRQGEAYKSAPVAANCVVLNPTWPTNSTPPSPCAAVFTEIDFPNGLSRIYKYSSGVYNGNTYYRIDSIVQNNGYQLRYHYSSDLFPASGAGDWFHLISVTAVNGVVDYCDPAATSCTYSRQWPTTTAVATPLNSNQTLVTLTDWAGRQTLITEEPGLLDSIVGPGRNETFYYGNFETCTVDIGVQNCEILLPFVVTKVVFNGGTWTYTRDHSTPPINTANEDSPVYYNFATRGTGPKGYVAFATFNTKDGYVSQLDMGNSYRFYSSDILNRLTGGIDPQGRNWSFKYDSRGNMVEKRQVAAANSGLSDLVVTGGFDTTCANPVKCNKPNWIKDAKGNETDYTYDPVHGGVLTETLPPDVPGGIRPQHRYSYAQRYAWLKNAAGTYSRAASPIWVLTQESYCRTGAPAASGVGCAQPSDEVLTTYDYGPDSGPNNLLLRGKAVTADGKTARTCYAYDALGNKISETSANAQLANCP